MIALALVLGCGTPAVAEPPPEPVAVEAPVVRSVHVDRAGRTIYLVGPSGTLHTEPIGIGRGGLIEKTAMSDLATPTGTFTVDLVLSRDGTHDAVDPKAVARFADEPAYAELLDGPEGLARLFANMSGIDFDGDGAPDRAYGDAYVGLHSDTAVTGPKMRRHSRSQTPYWYSIALHETPVAANLGAANSGGCVHVSSTLLQTWIADGTPGPRDDRHDCGRASGASGRPIRRRATTRLR